MDVVSLRRKELAEFFSKIANSLGPRKLRPEQLHDTLNRHGYMALEVTGKRVTGGEKLPFFTVTYV